MWYERNCFEYLWAYSAHFLQDDLNWDGIHPHPEYISVICCHLVFIYFNILVMEASICIYFLSNRILAGWIGTLAFPYLSIMKHSPIMVSYPSLYLLMSHKDSDHSRAALKASCLSWSLLMNLLLGFFGFGRTLSIAEQGLLQVSLEFLSFCFSPG